MGTILLSDLAVEQLKSMPEPAGRHLLSGLERLRAFPESAPTIRRDGFEQFRQVVSGSFRAVYLYDSVEDIVKIYCILHKRRQLPSAEFLHHQIF